MAIRTREEILALLATFTEGREDDETLSLVEDITDTVTYLEENTGDVWKEKYEKNDREWRKKYKERFFSVTPDPEPNPELDPELDPEPDPEPITYDELFSDIIN